jgi:hypothetical protein
MIYTEEWIDWGDYLGNSNRSNQTKNKEYWSFQKVREFARGLGFKNREQYYEWHKHENPRYMPLEPQGTYRKKEWKGWTDFLDTGNEKVEPLPYEEAKKVVQEQHFTSQIIASVLYSTGSLGNIRTETLKAFSMAEAVNIIEKIS